MAALAQLGQNAGMAELCLLATQLGSLATRPKLCVVTGGPCAGGLGQWLMMMGGVFTPVVTCRRGFWERHVFTLSGPWHQVRLQENVL